MKVFSAEQVRMLDASTIEEENIVSHQLMERAAHQFTNRLLQKYPVLQTAYIFCGTGNNGGDGLCVARFLYAKNYHAVTFVVGDVQKASNDFVFNFKRLEETPAQVIFYDGNNFPAITNQDIIIDAVFGSGLNRKAEGIYEDIIEKINATPAKKISIDVPSGFFFDAPTPSPCIQANETISFQFPKLGFFFPENSKFTGSWETVDIGLSKNKIQETDASAEYILADDAKQILKKRSKFSHKGTYGHTLVIAGNEGMEGAAALAGKACLMAGSGLVTLCSQSRQWFYPELMHVNTNELLQQIQSKKYNALAVGPGLGANIHTKEILETVFKKYQSPLVLDADALNTLAEHKTLLNKIPVHSIFTPHPKEFERLFGTTANSFEQLELQKTMSVTLRCFIILKRAYTCITTPEGKIFFNSTGNPGMATAGSGDVLTGMIAALLAQNYSAEHAVVFGVYLHGLAGDLALKKTGGQNVNATDIIENIQYAYSFLQTNKPI